MDFIAKDNMITTNFYIIILITNVYSHQNPFLLTNDIKNLIIYPFYS